MCSLLYTINLKIYTIRNMCNVKRYFTPWPETIRFVGIQTFPGLRRLALDFKIDRESR